MTYEKLFKEYFKQILSYKGYKIFDIKHFISEYKNSVKLIF